MLIFLLVLLAGWIQPGYDPVRLDAVLPDRAYFSTAAPCQSGQDEPVIAVYVAESDDWFYFDDALFVGGVDGCHYEMQIKPGTYRVCLAWPDTTISGVWLQDGQCWQRPTRTLWVPIL